jgi:2-polyprenyl-6-methoxyphenol hydroxylase-like FAD-dependent oxidoreductase
MLIVGAGPAGLIRAISATLQGLKTVVLELRPEDAPRRPQIAVIRSEAVIALLDQLGALDFLFKENRIFPFGRLKLEVSLGDLELAFAAILRLVADERDRIIQYGVFVERIDERRGLALVIARQSGQQALLSFAPRLIVIADGKRSPTSALLGISRHLRFRSHTGIIAIFRAGAGGRSWPRRLLGALASKLSYAFHRHVTHKGSKLDAGTILQVPGHHYLGLDLTPDEETRLREAMAETGDGLQDMLRFWARYAFEAIRTHPKGSAPHTGGRPIAWLPLDPQLAMPIELMSDRADVFCGHIGKTFVMIEGDAQFTIHPGSAYGCAKAFLSARLFDFLLRAGLSDSDERRSRAAERAFLVNAELMERECNKITRFFKART